FAHARHLQQALGTHRVAEDAHQVVFHRQIEAAGARIALAPGTAAQLIVDTARLVPLGADDVQPTRRQHLGMALFPGGAGLLRRRRVDLPETGQLRLQIAAEHDVGAAARHVGGDGHGAGLAGLRDDQRFTLVLLGVQHLVRDGLLLQQARQELRGLDRGRADQYRLLPRHAIADVLDDRLELVILRQIDEVRVVLADHRAVRGHHDDLQTVDLQELRGFRVGRAGHAGELLVQAEVVLESDRGDRLILFANADAFLRLHRLVQAVRPAPALHGPAGELIDDDDFAA